MLRRTLLAAVVGAGLAGGVQAQDAQPVTVFAAASLKNALDETAKAYTDATGKLVTISYAASSALAKQIEQGAPADLFFSADRDWVKYLDEKGLLRSQTITELLGNRIVLVAPADSAAATTIAPGFDLAGLLGTDGKLAMADPASVPAGKYGKAALEALGVWSSVEAKVARAENVRAALALVARGEAPAGIVYATDAAAEPKVKILDTFPADTHPAIVYPVAVVRASVNADVVAFLAWLKGAKAGAAFTRQGFTLLQPAA